MAKQLLIGPTGELCSGENSWAETIIVKRLDFYRRSNLDGAREHIAEHPLSEPAHDLVRETTTMPQNGHSVDQFSTSAFRQTGVRL